MTPPGVPRRDHGKLTIYSAIGLERSELCQPVDDDDFETIVELIDGHPRAATWQPITMHLIGVDERGRKFERSDSPWHGSWALIFRPAAVLALGKLLRENGELLPLRCEGGELWMFNPRSVDALDVDGSTIERFDDGSIVTIPRPVFRPEALRGVDAFKLPGLRVSRTYLGQRLVDAWHEAGLEGLEFEVEWTEE